MPLARHLPRLNLSLVQIYELGLTNQCTPKELERCHCLRYFGAMTPCLVEKVLVYKFFRAMCSTYMEKRVLKKELILVGLIGFTLVGCSDVTRVSYSVPPELMQVRMEAASLLEEANSIEETGATIGRGLISELETLAPQISSNSADIEKFKSYLSELEGLKDSDVE